MKASEHMELPLVVSDRCTLCGACSNACPTRALRTQVFDGHVQLFLGVSDCRPFLCRGLCVSLCPENAISLRFTPQEADTEAVVLMEDGLVRCKACGLPYTSERMKNHTQMLLARGKANKAAIDAMDYCPVCRRSESLALLRGMMSASR